MTYQNIIKKYKAMDAVAQAEYAKKSSVIRFYEVAKKSLADGIKANITNISQNTGPNEGDVYFELTLGDVIINGFVTDRPILCGRHDCTHQVGLSHIFMKGTHTIEERKEYSSAQKKMLCAIIDDLGLELETSVAEVIAKACGVTPKNIEGHHSDSRWVVIKA